VGVLPPPQDTSIKADAKANKQLRMG